MAKPRVAAKMRLQTIRVFPGAWLQRLFRGSSGKGWEVPWLQLVAAIPNGPPVTEQVAGISASRSGGAHSQETRNSR